ncbi:hypothetical protein ABPG75_002523 [Micractinium tetrahymenae]
MFSQEASSSALGLPNPLIDALKHMKDSGPNKSLQHGGAAAAGGAMASSGLPPRQSSDSTLHPEPSGRPSSAPSCRSSFESCVDSRRQSFDDNSHALPPWPPAPRGTTLGPAAAARLGAAAAAAQQSSEPGQNAGVEASGQGPSQLREHLLQELRDSSPFGPQAHQQTSRGVHEGPARRAAQLGLAGHSNTHLHAERRRRTGRHPANLEHCSTEPPGAIDELAELLLAAANLAVEGAPPGATSSASSGHGGSSADNSSRGGTGAAALVASHGARSSSAQAIQAGEERGSAPVRRSAPAAAEAEPLLSSQVALLAQQLLLQQQQQQQHGGGVAPQLRSSLEQPWQQPLQQPLSRSRTVAADELLQGRQGPMTAADMLRGLAGSGGSGPQVSVEATPVLQSLDASHQPRFSGPTPLEIVEQGSPFSAIQGAYGCHLLPPADPADVVSPMPSPNLTTRSSIDLLLDPAMPASARTHRHSLDTLAELLMSNPVSVHLGSPATTAAQFLQQVQGGNVAGGIGNAVRPRPVVNVRHSMDSGGAAARLDAVACTLSTLPGSRSRRAGRSIVDPAASYYGHMSAGAMHDIANSTVTVVAGAVPAPSVAQPLRTTVSAHASSMVDPAARPAGAQEAACVGTPEDLMLDPDLHDTFGAHPSYGLPAAARPRHRHSSSGGSSGRGAGDSAASLLDRSSSGGSATGAARGAVADGWRQPAGAPRRPPLPPGSHNVGACNAAAAAPPAGGPLAAAAAAGGSGAPPQPHPTVYQPHLPPTPSTATDFSPIGNAPLLEPTTVPGQHSVTVHDPQHSIPSLAFLRQCALARKKLERMDSSSAPRGGYIAEAKRVLAAAVHTASEQEAAVVESSCSGAIGPLLRYLRDNKHNDAALRSGLHTLSLLVTNSPNRGIIVSFHGQAMLCEAMRATRDLELRENIVQLLWDLEAHNKECHFDPEDVVALQAVLEATSNAHIASHILHLLCHCFIRSDAPAMSREQMQLCAQRLVDEIAAHKHHLQDAAQYAVGNLMAVVLGDSRVPPPQRQRHVTRLLEELRKTNTAGQCQVVLTVLSCMAGNARVRSAMAHCHARRCLMDFGQHIPDPRLRARSLSLIKILHKQETLESQVAGSWYFGGAGAHGSEVSGSPPSR